MSKSIFRSKTLWFNALTLLPLMVDAVATNMALLQPVVPAKWYPLIALGVGVGNVWLRVVTTQAIEFGKKKE